MKLTFLASAKQDLEDIVTYISEDLESPESAQRILRDIVRHTDSLVSFPRSGVLLEELSSKQKEYRSLIAGKYVVIYHCTTDDVLIIRVIHASLDYTRLF